MRGVHCFKFNRKALNWSTTKRKQCALEKGNRQTDASLAVAHQIRYTKFRPFDVRMGQLNEEAANISARIDTRHYPVTRKSHSINVGEGKWDKKSQKGRKASFRENSNVRISNRIFFRQIIMVWTRLQKKAQFATKKRTTKQKGRNPEILFIEKCLRKRESRTASRKLIAAVARPQPTKKFFVTCGASAVGRQRKNAGTKLSDAN